MTAFYSFWREEVQLHLVLVAACRYAAQPQATNSQAPGPGLLELQVPGRGARTKSLLLPTTYRRLLQDLRSLYAPTRLTIPG